MTRSLCPLLLCQLTATPQYNWAVSSTNNHSSCNWILFDTGPRSCHHKQHSTSTVHFQLQRRGEGLRIIHEGEMAEYKEAAVVNRTQEPAVLLGGGSHTHMQATLTVPETSVPRFTQCTDAVFTLPALLSIGVSM